MEDLIIPKDKLKLIIRFTNFFFLIFKILLMLSGLYFIWKAVYEYD